MDGGGDADTYDWPDDGGHPVPADDSVFGYSWNGTSDEHGGGVDGSGESGVHASGVAD